MYSISAPKQYRSVFREPCFVVGDLTAPCDMQIIAENTIMGVKRLYPAASASINAGPYVRGRLFIEPQIIDSFAPFVDSGRTVACHIRSGGYISETVYLTGGTEDAPSCGMVSAAPRTVAMRRGEFDEISFTTDGRAAKTVVRFVYDGGEREENVYFSLVDRRIVTMPVSERLMELYFTGLTGVDAGKLQEFTVEIVVAPSGSLPEVRFGRRYLIDGTAGEEVAGGCRRLAWINRYGAIDYYTFPRPGGSRIAGSRTRIETTAGYRTVGTAAENFQTLVSEPCDERMAEWLSELFSSPAVWVVADGVAERVEVSGGEVECSPLQPAVVSVIVSPAVKTVSRKF